MVDEACDMVRIPRTGLITKKSIRNPLSQAKVDKENLNEAGVRRPGLQRLSCEKMVQERKRKSSSI